MKQGKRALALILAVATILTSNSFYTVSATDMNAENTEALADNNEQSQETQKTEEEKDTGNTESNGGQTNAPATSENQVTEKSTEADPANSAQNQAPAALNSTPSVYADNEKAFSISASVSTASPILSGLGFNYYIHYNVPPLEEQGKSYTSGQITIELPAHIHVKQTETGALSISGMDVENSYLVPLADGKNMLMMDLVNPLRAGTAKDISINLTTDNFEIADETKVKLSPKLTASAEGNKVTGTIPENEKPEVTIQADDGWNIEKNVGEIKEEDSWYIVPYTIKAVNQKSGADADANRYGRLKIESFSITDLLPSITDGMKNNYYNGYPENGGAQIVSVTMGADNEAIPYNTVEYNDGSIKSITFDDYETSNAEDGNIGADKPITTSYTVTVKYPKDPYVTPSDEELREYFLQNEASLSYKLLGQNETTVRDTADITLGVKEKPGTSYDLTVEKLGSISGSSFNIAQAGGSARFALYKNPECTVLANDITGEHVAGTAQTTDKSTGKLTFRNLRRGTYYLKESEPSSGWKEMSPNPLKVEVGESVTVEDTASANVTAGNVLQITDTTDTLGIVEFYKYGKNAEGIIEKLKEAAFELTSKSDGKKYVASSDDNGLVRFYGVPAGSYTLAETAIKDTEYEKSNKVIDNIVVTGNQVTVPEGLDTFSFNNNETKGFLNISPKGVLQIKKVSSKPDENGGITTLSGAEFEIYGPYDNAGTAIGKNDKPVGKLVTGADGTALSSPLDAGYYVLKEIKAPEGYAVDPASEYTSVKVTANEVTPADIYVIKNNPMIPFTIHKQGVVKAADGSTAYTEELPGAEFKIYDSSSGGNLLGTLITKADSTGKAISNTLDLAPGTYYYEETKTPDGYTPIPGRVEFTLPLTQDGDNTSQLLITNHAHYGQIKIVKTDEGDAGKLLPGAEFKIYSDEACTKLEDTVITDKDGIALSKLLPVNDGAGTNYWIKETKAPDGYALLVLNKEMVTVKTGEQTEVKKPNLELTSIRITKTDSKTKQPIKGVKYGLFTKASDGKFNPVTKGGTSLEQVTETTDSNGICTFKGLQPDTDYYVKELETSADYVLDETMQGPIHTASGIGTNKLTSVSYTNDRKARLLVNKTTTMDTDNLAGLPMAGVEFTLYKYKDSAADGRGELIGTAVTRLNGDKSLAQAVFDNLVPGEYVLVETKLPQDEAGGYDKMQYYSERITVNAGDNQTAATGVTGYRQNIITVSNEAVNGRLKIEKIGKDQEGNKKNINATFGLFTDQNCKIPVKDASGKEIKLTTGIEKDKIAESGWFAPGTYYLKEETVDSEYTMSSTPIEVIIEKGKTTSLTGEKAITNDKKGKINLKKQAAFKITRSESAEPQRYDLKGAAFVLIKKSGVSSTIQQDVTKESFEKALGNPNTKIDLSNRVSGMSGWLDAGDYWIVEYKVPKDYIMDTLKGTKIDSIQQDGASVYVWNDSCTIVSGKETNGQDNTVIIDNTTDNGKLRLFKRAFSVSGNLLDGAQFEVYVVDNTNGTDTEVETEHGKTTVKLRQVNVSNSTDGGGEIMESGTAGKGSAVTIDIEPGTYYLKETGTDKITPSGDWHWYHQWTGPLEVEKGKETQTTIRNYKMEGVGTKTDKNNNPQKGAVFGVFETESEANTMSSYIQENNISIYNANYDSITQEQKAVLDKYKKDIKNTEFLSDTGIIQTAVSEADGKIKFEGLVPGKTYYILELLSPSGYEISREVKSVEVKSDGTGFKEDPSFQNYKLGRFKVVKYTTLNGKNYAVEGVGFEVYKVKKTGDTVITDKSQYASKELMASGTTDVNGFYTSILLPAGEYIVFEVSVPKDGVVEKNTNDEENYRVITIERGETNEVNKVMENGKGFYNPAVKGKFILKKTTVPVKGSNVNVEFQLEKSTGAGWEKVKTFTVKANGPSYESDFLDAGTYRIYETKALGLTMAYTKDNPLEFKIEGGKITGCTTDGAVFTGSQTDSAGNSPSTDASIDQPMVIQNQRQGSLQIKKQGAFGSESSLTDITELKNVTFSLYRKVTEDSQKDCENQDNKVSTVSTYQNGIARWNNLDAGSYWLKEDSLGLNGNYTLDTSIRLIEIKSGGINSEYISSPIINFTNYGKLQIKKTDANDSTKTLEAVYNIYTDKACTLRAKDIKDNDASIVTNAGTGIGLSGLLKTGRDYYLKEAKAPDGYELDKTAYGPYKVSPNTVTDISPAVSGSGDTFTDKKLFEIRVEKKDTKTTNSLKGAKIGLYRSAECRESDLIEAKITGDNGVVLFTNLTVDVDGGVNGSRIYYVKEIEAPEGYDLNKTSYPVEIKYSEYKTARKVTYTVEVGNDQLGKMQLLKKGDWQDIDETSMTSISLKGAEFKVYPVLADGQEHSAGTVPSDTVTTGSNGLAITKGLAAGWYEIVETKAPDGYALNQKSWWVQVENNKTNDTFVRNPIINVPDKGRFSIEKYDGSKGQSGLTLIGNHRAAEFKLQRMVDGKWTDVKGENIKLVNGKYMSNPIAPGEYRLIETVAPIHTYIKDGHSYAVEFRLDDTPVRFTVAAGETRGVNQADGKTNDPAVYNSPLGSIHLTKTGNQNNNEKLSGAAFELYTDAECKEKVKDSLKYTGADGTILWEKLTPGDYWVKEVSTESSDKMLDEKGYGINGEPVKVTIAAGQLLQADLTQNITVTDKADKGKLLIIKEDELSQNRLSGAVFKIYAKDKNGVWNTKPSDTVNVSENGGYSKLLPAAEEGTEYKVVETKAPSGYTLDATLSELEQVVTIYPLHQPAAGQNEDKNIVTFENRSSDTVVSFVSDIKKQVRKAGTDGWAESTAAEQSLLEDDYTAEFLVDGYADGKNDIGASLFTVTDNQLVMQKRTDAESSTPSYETIAGTDKDYTINSVSLLPSGNADAGKKITAAVYIQKTLAEKAADTWHLYKEKVDVTGGAGISFTPDGTALAEGEKVIGVKVEYENVDKGFTSGGMILNVTFLNRSEWSTTKDNEVRRIVNTAALQWTSRKVDENGAPAGGAGESASENSNPVYITFPQYKASLPETSITNQIINQKATYYSGDNIQYEVIAENHKVAGKNEMFRRPVISMRMPAMTALKSSLNGNGYVNGFLVTLLNENGTETVIPASSYKVETEATKAPLKDKGNDEYEESDKLTSTQYVFNFNDSVVMSPGDRIKINYTGVISYEAKSNNGVTDLVCPAYLSSTEKVALSAENPLGLSFIPFKGASNQELHDNNIIDGTLADDLQYMNATVTAEVSDSKVVQLVKYIGVKKDNGDIEWKGPGELAQLNPNETYYYKLVLMNNSTDELTKARIVDILPFNGDTYVMQAGGTFTNRGTTIPAGDGFEDVTVKGINTKDNKLKIYSTDYDWTIRRDSEQNKDGILGMMYDRTAGFTGTGWTAGADTKSTALGFDIDFSENHLKPYDSYEIIFEAKAPGYTADKIQDYYEKVIENSAMASVTRAGTEDNPNVELSDRMEPEKVTAMLALPTGSIGDYVWFDQNNDGIQGTKKEGDEPAQGIEATLYKKTYTKLNGQIHEDETAVDTTVTDQNGWYQFDGLACKYLKEGASKDSKDPDDYVGGEYYEYRVKFDITGYTATDRYQGPDKKKDSDIDPNGYTEYITLSVSEGKDGTLSGEQDMTIDAGLVSPYALGDYVWLDRNNDGIQGAGEPGVEGVSVFLYRVGSSGEAEEDYLARTTTDKDGKYLFENLIQGKYVIEFDISNLRKDNESHTYRYDFTKAGSQADNAQSDARYPVDADGRIKRTDVINLTKEELAQAAGNDGVSSSRDLRWDAGLVVYSALGGYCFDDRDYNDIHTINIPLEGTVVTLYEKDGNSIGKEIGTTTAGADGRYYFDHLIFPGEEQTYLIRFDYPDGYTGVDSNAGTDDTIDSDALYDSNYWNWEELGLDRRKSGYAEVTLKKDTEDTTWDAGARKYSSIGDYVWEDENKNGKQDEGETPVPGVKVVLQSRDGEGGEWKFYAQTVTDGKGRYLFTDVKSSDRIDTQYRVVFALDRKIKVTTCQQLGVSDEMNSDAINSYQYDIVQGTPENPITGGYVTRMLKPGYGETDLTWDAGIVHLLSAVGDYTWYDDDYDGIQEEGEAPAADIAVVLEYNETGDLENESAWTAAGKTLTDENGKYLFDGLLEGYYRVKFQVPDGYTATKYGQTSDLEKDSDAMIRGGNRWFTTKSFYLEAGVTDLSWDAGIYKPKVRVITRTRDRIITRIIRIIRPAGRGVRTGDYSPIAALILLLAVSGGTAAFIIIRRKKNKKS